MDTIKQAAQTVSESIKDTLGVGTSSTSSTTTTGTGTSTTLHETPKETQIGGKSATESMKEKCQHVGHKAEECAQAAKHSVSEMGTKMKHGAQEAGTQAKDVAK